MIAALEKSAVTDQVDLPIGRIRYNLEATFKDGATGQTLKSGQLSFIVASVLLPAVGRHGYGTMFFAFAGCTVVYFVTATFILPEAKGKTLEEIEEHFEGVQ
jgi:hypothetical protein